MTITTTKLLMGFQSANSRPACRNCFHGEESYGEHDVKTWYCKKGGFGTTAMAFCAQHLPVQRGGASHEVL